MTQPALPVPDTEAPGFPRPTTNRVQRLLTLVRAGLTLIAFVWIATYFIEHRTAIYSAAARYNIETILAALGVVLLGLLPGAWAWQRLLVLRLPSVSAIRGSLIYLRSGIGKYTPGGALAFAIQHRLLQKEGSRPLMLLQVFVGAALAACLAAALLGLPAVHALFGVDVVFWGGLGVTLAVGLVLAHACRLGHWFILPVLCARIGMPPPGPFVQIVLLMLGAWTLTGLHLVILGVGTEADPVFLISAYAFSAIAGIVFAVLPGAFGVRDGALLIILAARLEPADAMMIALLSRTLVVVGDVIGAGLATLAMRPASPLRSIERNPS